MQLRPANFHNSTRTGKLTCCCHIRYIHKGKIQEGSSPQCTCKTLQIHSLAGEAELSIQDRQYCWFATHCWAAVSGIATRRRSAEAQMRHVRRAIMMFGCRRHLTCTVAASLLQRRCRGHSPSRPVAQNTRPRVSQAHASTISE